MNSIPRNEFLELSQSITNVVVGTLRDFQSGTLQLSGEGLKGEHIADHFVYSALCKFFQDLNISAQVYIESNPSIKVGNGQDYSIFIDPVDGSINRDLRVGDPAVVIAYAQGLYPRFGDIFGGYVYGLHSNDTYYSFQDVTYYVHQEEDPIEISCDSTVTTLKDAILYYNDGYGQELARASFRKAGALPMFVKHHNAFDNSAMEICQICRGAAHLRVEARASLKAGELRGSDHANILAAFAIGKGAGLIVSDLDGNLLDDVLIEIDKVQDFICSNSSILLEEVLDVLSKNKEHVLELINS